MSDCLFSCYKNVIFSLSKVFRGLYINFASKLCIWCIWPGIQLGLIKSVINMIMLSPVRAANVPFPNGNQLISSRIKTTIYLYCISLHYFIFINWLENSCALSGCLSYGFIEHNGLCIQHKYLLMKYGAPHGSVLGPLIFSLYFTLWPKPVCIHAVCRFNFHLYCHFCFSLLFPHYNLEATWHSFVVSTFHDVYLLLLHVQITVSTAYLLEYTNKNKSNFSL